MTTLNARANSAYWDLIKDWNREHPDWEWMGFDHQRDAFETGWETGYKAALDDHFPLVDRPAVLDEGVLIGVAVREFADKHGIPLPEDDEGCKGEGRGTGR